MDTYISFLKLNSTTSKLPQNYKIEVGIYSSEVTEYTNKIVNYASLPKGWTEIVGTIARPNFNPYSYSVDLEVFVNSNGKGCTGVIINPGVTGTIKFCYMLVGY